MIVQAGKQFTAADLKRTAGDLAAMITDHVQSANDFGSQLSSWVDADLLALGLTQEEVNGMKGFFIGDAPQLKTVLANSSSLRVLIGTGV